MSVFDHGSVNLTLPSIADQFGTDLSGVQWISLGYALSVSIFLLPAGYMADRFGPKETYVSGIVIFATGTGLAGFANSVPMIMGLRVISAVGSAMIMATGMAILIAVFPRTERGKVLGTHMTIVGAGSIFGPVLGGAFVGIWGWRSVFFLNPIIGLLGLASALLVLDSLQLSSGNSKKERGGYDWAGVMFLALTLLTFLLTITYGNSQGWTSPIIMAGFVISLALVIGFLIVESRVKVPILDLTLFNNRVFSMGVLAGFIAFLSTASLWFLLPFYLQNVRGIEPLSAGLVMVSSAAAMAVMGSIAGRLSDRFGWKPFNIVGPILTGSGLLIISRVDGSQSLGFVVVGLILVGFGNGMFHPTNHSSIMGAVDPSKYGVVSAFVNLNRNTASTIGLAMATAIVIGTMNGADVAPHFTTVTGVTSDVSLAFTKGLGNAYSLAGWLMGVAMAISILKPQSNKEASIHK
jgi:EmrB/QacA subfamily drug resistance transporter